MNFLLFLLSIIVPDDLYPIDPAPVPDEDA